jgi:hypothetical protein
VRAATSQDPDGLFAKVHISSLHWGGALVKTSAVCGPATAGQPLAISFQPCCGLGATVFTAYCLLPTAFGARSLLGVSSRQGVKHKVGKGPNERRRIIQAHHDVKTLDAETRGQLARFDIDFVKRFDVVGDERNRHN